MPIIKTVDIIKNNYKLSPSNYINTNIKNANLKKLEYFIKKPIEKGVEIGSQNYVEKSDYHFLRTSAFDENSFSLKLDNNSFININPNVFIKKSLKEGDILICKDSNVGEVAIISNNIDNTMFSAGINRICFKDNSKYIYAVMKNQNFKKQLDSLIPKGATLKHAKDIYLQCKIPEITDKEDIKYIENIVDIIIHKEKLIKEKKQIIDNCINMEIENNQKEQKFTYKFPTLKELITINRIDTGNYTSEFKVIDFKIKNYKYGYYTIDSKKIKGGNTPKKRYIKKDNSLKYLWVTPTYINDNGTLKSEFSIECDNNNINQNCALIVNRTSKGGQGEYVGIASFFDYNKLGKAQHNQGIYRIFNYSDNDLIFITCILNSNYYRKYCANLSMGSKMKELKLNNIISIPFPKFKTDKKLFICNSFYNKLPKNNNISKLNILKDNYKWDIGAGLLDIYFSLEEAKKHLTNIVNCLYEGKAIKKEYKIF